MRPGQGLRVSGAWAAAALGPLLGLLPGCVGWPDAAGDPQDPGAAPAPPAPWRVATFNVENLFDPDPANGAGGEEEASATPSESTYAARLSAISTVVGRLGADLVVLQEVESRRALDELAEHVSPPGRYPFRYLFEGNDPRGIDLAVLSRTPVARLLRHDTDVFRVLTATCETEADASSPRCRDYRYARDCLELHLVVRGQPIVLLGVHLKARQDGTDADDAKRLAEAQHTRRIADRLLAEDPALPLAVLGDLNAWPTEPAAAALRGEPAACACAGPPLVSVTEELAAEDAHTTYSRDLDRPALYDDLLLSPGAATLLIPGSVDIVHDEELPAAAAAASDHDPVAASLLVGSG